MSEEGTGTPPQCELRWPLTVWVLRPPSQEVGKKAALTPGRGYPRHREGSGLGAGKLPPAGQTLTLPRASECECCLEWGPQKRWLVTAGPWAPSPEAGDGADLGVHVENGRTNTLPRTRCWWAEYPCAPSTGQQVQGRVEGDDQALPPTRSARPAAPLPERRRLLGGAAGGRWGGAGPLLPTGALLSSLGASPHLALRAPSVLGCRWGGRKPQCSAHHPCGFPALCPRVRPQPLGCPHLDMPSVSSGAG